jgi:hypothetical protein
MQKKLKMNWTLTLTALGVIAAWTPFLLEEFSPTKIKGKILSMYDNIGTWKGESKGLFVFKLSVICLNQSFNLKDIDIDIKFRDNGLIHSSSVNQRNTYFTLDNKLKHLLVSEGSFLNNLTLLKKGEPAVGYILTTCPPFKNDKIVELIFIFKSFKKKVKKLSFKIDEIDDSKLLYDDSIWVTTDSTKL